MPHLKCEPCRGRVHDVGGDDQAGGACPECGSLLEPVGDLSELVGLKLLRSATASADAAEPSWQQGIADQLAGIIVRCQAAYGDGGRD